MSARRVIVATRTGRLTTALSLEKATGPLGDFVECMTKGSRA